MKKSEKRRLSRQQKVSALLAVVNALGSLAPLAVPAAASLAELPPSRRQEVDAAWQAGLARGGQILDSLLFSTACAAITLSSTATVVGTVNEGIVWIGGGQTLSVAGSGSVINAAGVAVDVNADQSTLTVYPGGKLSGATDGVSFNNVSSSTATLAGTVTGGVAGVGISGGAANVVTINGGTVTGGTYGIADSGTANVVNIAGGTVTGGTAALALTGASGQVNVTGNAAVAGVVLNGTANTMTVASGTVNGLAVGGNGNTVNVQSAGTVILAAGSNVGGTVNNSGAINLSGATGTFTLANLALSGGALTFSPGPTAGRRLNLSTLSGSGSFSLYTNLASGYADTITVTGTANGSHRLYITDTGGATGSGQIAKVVDLPGGSTATFTGGGDVGAYRYTVVKGSYLSASLDAEDYYFAYPGPSATSQAAMSLSAGTIIAWYGEMNEIKKRMGDLRMGSQSSDDVWARAYASKFTVKPGVSGDASLIMRGLEVGKDNPQSFTGGKKYTGFVLGKGRSDATYNAGGSGTTDSNYAGAYVSWLRDDGNFVDIIGKYNWFSNRFNTASDSGSYRNTGFGLSAEIGKRFDKGNGTYIEPAAELGALWAGKASYTTANGLPVDTPAAQSLQLRLGVTAGRSWKGADGATRQVYGKVSWVNEYKGESTTRVDGAAFDSNLKGHQWVTGIGFVEDKKHYQLFIDAEKSWGTAVSKEWGFNLGCRWKF
ncbi:autotransporter outer membrane beta-barrel domain-containing protein [Anaeroselena agilis]|uniref:Autotransporter outer membrane beta-barrel domain-containing protein n=1 Tax=Anaeroselena agilis TaxID=3063788 RepID=A0ABU3P2C8_9FIRM|nr:autotransporter outer membrane beta-barrel domain-containing protein [Selenomonadales bacterium 4137-cl]